VEESNLNQSIFLLRKALGETTQDHRYIVTIPGRGYRFAESVRLVAADEADLISVTLGPRGESVKSNASAVLPR
jgi:DNA-binding winged helix-turn-helix (wHTH) protein